MTSTATRLAPADRANSLRAVAPYGGSTSTRLEAGLLGVVLLVGLVARAWRPDLAKVQYDEAAAASLVAAWKFDGLFPIAGTIGSTGFANPPGWPYIVAPGLLISNSPYAMLAVGLAAGMLTVGLTWWVGRRWFGRWAGLAAATFYAGGFFPVLVGRTAWQLAFLPPLTLVCLDALLMLAVRRRPWALAAACGWLGLMFQFHYVTAIHVLMLPLAMWPARGVLRPRHLGAGVLMGLLGVWPFPIYELNPAVRLHDLISLVVSQGGTPRVDLSVVNYLWNLSSNGGAVGLATPTEAGLRALFGRWTAGAMFGSLLVAGGVLAAVAWWPRDWRGWLVVTWLALPQIVLARHTLDVLLHYSYPELPVLALAAGVLVGAAATGTRRVPGLAAHASRTPGLAAHTSRIPGLAARTSRLSVFAARASRAPGLALLPAAALLVYVASSLGTLFVSLGYIDHADTHLGYGIPLRDSSAAGQAARALAPPGAPIVIGAHHYNGEILRFSIGYDRQSQTFDDCRSLPYLPGAVYLLLSEQTPGSDVLETAGAAQLARLPRPGDAYRIYAAPPLPFDAADLRTHVGSASQECRERADWNTAVDAPPKQP